MAGTCISMVSGLILNLTKRKSPSSKFGVAPNPSKHTWTEVLMPKINAHYPEKVYIKYNFFSRTNLCQFTRLVKKYDNFLIIKFHENCKSAQLNILPRNING